MLEMGRIRPVRAGCSIGAITYGDARLAEWRFFVPAAYGMARLTWQGLGCFQRRRRDQRAACAGEDADQPYGGQGRETQAAYVWPFPASSALGRTRSLTSTPSSTIWSDRPLRVTSTISAVAKGDLSQSIALELDGRLRATTPPPFAAPRFTALSTEELNHKRNNAGRYES